MVSVKTALTIAGTDPTGGAGIQADLKTFQEREVYGMSVLTSAVAQNTTGVQAVAHMPIDFIDKQLDSVMTDIRPDAIKTGMIAKSSMIELIADYLARFPDISYVLDPVMVATSGDELIEKESQAIIRRLLVPLATVVTPNIPEAELLIEEKISTFKEMEHAARKIVDQLGAKSAVVKGGHLSEGATDIFYNGKTIEYLTADRFETVHTHGTGCTFAAAITAELAKGLDCFDAVRIAKQFITDAIRYPLNLGIGNGPTNHWGYRLKGLPSQRSEHHHG